MHLQALPWFRCALGIFVLIKDMHYLLPHFSSEIIVKAYFFTYWHLFKQFWFRLWSCHGNILCNYPHWKDRLWLFFFSSTAKDVLKPAYWLPFPAPSNLILLEQWVRAPLKAMVIVTRINKAGRSFIMKLADLFVHSDHIAWGMFVYATGWLMPSQENKFKRELKKHKI